MSDATKKQGAADAAQGRGQRDPKEFSSDIELKDYQAGYDAQKRSQQR